MVLEPPSRRTPAQRIYRHRLPVRVMHWINVVAITLALMSGLQIFNAHPALYWGHASDFASPWLAISARDTAAGPVGVARIAGIEWDTTGVLGLSQADGRLYARGFPSWATVPGPQGLALARRWHFFFAWVFVLNGVAYLLYTVFSRHLTRDLLPTRAELRGIGSSIKNHLRLRHPSGDAAKRYNVLQSLAYLGLIFGLLPLLLVAGLAMAPRLDTVYTGWVDLLGGRQSARSLHFIAAAGLALFTAVHLFEVVVAGAWNEVRSMVTGWYVLPVDKTRKGP
jgi:thiosulfate reductase cytochrome b subunit